jgi:putative ABC transport system permease protein
VALQNPNYPTFGTAAVQVTLPGSDPQLAPDIATIQNRWGPTDLIVNQDIANGSTQPVQLRAENPHGHYNSPLLGLVSGTYPAGPGQVALTNQVAAQYGAHVGGAWPAAGTTWRVTGVVQDPSNLADEFALVAPGQVTHPSQVIMLLGSAAVQRAVGNGTGTLPGIPGGGDGRDPQHYVGRHLAGGARPGGGGARPGVHRPGVGGRFLGDGPAQAAGPGHAQRDRRHRTQSPPGHDHRRPGRRRGRRAGRCGAGPRRLVGVVVAIATSVLASRRPAKAMAALPVVAALAGRPAPPKAVHRSALPGVIAFTGGVACLALTGGWAGGGGGGGGGKDALLLLVGLVATIVGILLLAPLAVSVLAAGAGSRLPVAIRIALRDLVRYRARSGAALAATTFAVFLATVICLVASIQFGNPLNWFGPNLSSSQLIFSSQSSPAPGMIMQLSNAQLASLDRQVNSYAAGLHAQFVLPLEAGDVNLNQAGTQGPHNHFNGSVYVATPQLLAAYGIKASQISPGTDIVTVRSGLASQAHLELTWGSYGLHSSAGGYTQKDNVLPPCTLSSDCVANPPIQTITGLPGGTSAPNTVITEYAMSKYHLQPSLTGWLIQAPGPLTAAQINAARHLALAYQVTVETKTNGPTLAEFADGATALGIVIALGVLAASVGLIRSETARDLRTLTATGASTRTRRMITAATAAALGLLGAILGLAGAVIAVLAWAHGSLSTVFGDVPLSDVLILLVGLPLAAAAGGWLLAGREPEFIARQPLD